MVTFLKSVRNMDLPEHRGQHDPDDGCILFSVGHEPRSGQASGAQVRLPFKQEHFSQPKSTAPPKFLKL